MKLHRHDRAPAVRGPPIEPLQRATSPRPERRVATVEEARAAALLSRSKPDKTERSRAHRSASCTDSFEQCDRRTGTDRDRWRAYQSPPQV